jgi:hypothetical protein
MSTDPIFQTQDTAIYATTPGYVDPPQPQEQPTPQQQQPILIQTPPPPVPVSKTLYLSTKHRSTGSPNDAFYNIDAGLRCGKAPGERITMTPVYTSIWKNWDTVNRHNRRFQIVVNGVANDCYLKIGSGYSCSAFGVEVQRVVQTFSTGFQVKYDRISNRYTFTPSDDRAYKISIPHRHLSGFMGFPQEMRETREFTRSNPLVSERNVSMAPQVSVVVSCDLVTTDNFNNFTHRHVCATGVILVIPIDSPPYGQLVYEAPTPNTGTLTLAANSVHHMRIWVTDETGESIDVSEWVLGIRYDIYPPNLA